MNGQPGISVGHEDLRFGEDGISTTSGGLPIDQAPTPARHQPADRVHLGRSAARGRQRGAYGARPLDWLGLHDLRHACASYLPACGASPRTVMKTLGHSQIALAMNTYAHVLPDIERAAVDAVAKQLFG
ncbi:site-specific integrase [Microbispora rosea]|uniref:site-specific integrase n=1 Tax=Microbispora rosea TaxID=58117 RepID=UPI0033E69E3D